MGLALSAWTGGGCLHSVRKGWPGALPELSPVTYSHFGRRPDPGLDSPGLPRAQPFATVQMERLGWGVVGRRLPRAPRQQSKCSRAGQTRGLVLPCPLNPKGLSHLEKTLPTAVPGSWALTEGASWLQDQGSRGWIFPWPAWPARTASSACGQVSSRWVGAGCLNQGLRQGTGGGTDPWPPG